MAPAPSSVSALRDQFSLRLIVSYAFDWIVLAVIAAVAYVLGRIEPNKRSFSLADRDVSFPYTEKETVPNWLLFVLCAVVPVVAILFVALIFVPGSTVPSSTPLSLVWKRKVWELHTAWLGLLMAVGSSWFFVSGIKNMCGKPRPDMLSRCKPDMANAAKYVVGGFQIQGANGQLFSADICTETDAYILDDGFRSYPSGHAAASAAGLIYLSLYLASKFAVTIPFIIPGHGARDAGAHAAFPSRMRQPETARSGYEDESWPMGSGVGGATSKPDERQSQHNQKIQSLRKQAAAPPVYLLAITLVPFCLSIFVSASRWFDYRHHGFDILFGFLIGIITSIYSFRYYHMPIRDGAGWAWAPRSPDRAFWAGVGRLGYAGDRVDLADAAKSASRDAQPYPATPVQRNGRQAYPEHEIAPNGAYAHAQDPRGNPYESRANGQYSEVEMQRLNQERV